MADLQEAVKKFASDLGAKVETFIADAENLEVKTYTTTTEGEDVLRAFTSVSFDGDTTVKVPVAEGGEINRAIWDLHQTMVQQAMANRVSMIESLGKAASTALQAVGIASE